MKTFFDNHQYKLYQFTPPKSRSGYDGTFKINERDTSVFFETKVREFPLETYDTYIIEVRKANCLAKWMNKGFDVKYFNFFKNNGGYDLIMFDLNQRIRVWRAMGQENVVEYKWMNQYTYKKSGKIQKAVIMIRYDDMIDMKFKNEIKNGNN